MIMMMNLWQKCATLHSFGIQQLPSFIRLSLLASLVSGGRDHDDDLQEMCLFLYADYDNHVMIWKLMVMTLFVMELSFTKFELTIN